jgi:hypothetical protein
VKGAVVHHVLAFEQQHDLLDAFIEARAALVEAHAEALELVRQEGARKAKIQPAVTDRVDHARFTGLERMVEGRQDGAGAVNSASAPRQPAMRVGQVINRSSGSPCR